MPSDTEPNKERCQTQMSPADMFRLRRTDNVVKENVAFFKLMKKNLKMQQDDAKSVKKGNKKSTGQHLPRQTMEVFINQNQRRYLPLIPPKFGIRIKAYCRQDTSKKHFSVISNF